MEIQVRAYMEEDLAAMTEIWNAIVEEGAAFPQMEPMTQEEAAGFFAGQSFTAVAEKGGEVAGLYILHPNNLGRCGHLCNASYAVHPAKQGGHVGEALVQHSLKKGGELGFRVLQFNAVVKSNLCAIHLYRKLGFTELGAIPGGFLRKDNTYEDIVLFYHSLL